MEYRNNKVNRFSS